MTKNTFTTNLKRNCALVTYIALSPVFLVQLNPSNQISTIAWDKVFHLSYYLFFALWLLWAKTSNRITFITLFSFGVLIEGLQSLTSYRSFELMDIVANTAGIIAAMIFFKLKNQRL